MEWEERRFDELGFIGRGKSRHRPRNDESLLGGKYPLVQTGEIKAANFYINEYSASYNEKGLAQSKLWQPNTLCITIAANIAETAILNIKACFPDSIIGFVADEEKCDVKFIKYFFDIYKNHMQRISQGATQDNLSLQKLLTFKVPTPPLLTQHKIASILGAYDDLIENNLKRIQLLEEAAQNLYKEWFVDFRFPNHENHPINEETGLPEGWMIGSIKDLVNVTSGYAYKSKNWKEKGYPVVKIKTIQNNTLNLKDAGFIDEETALKTEKYRLKEGEIVIAMTGATVGKTGLVPKTNKDVFLNKRVGAFKPFSTLNNIPLIFCFFNSIDGQKQVLNYAQGAAQANISAKQIENLKVIIPDNNNLKRFNFIEKKLIDQISVLNFHNYQLQEARDLLLPRLMNQEIEV